MLISLNYLITGMALFFAYALRQRGEHYMTASKHMLCFAFAALLGGLAHHMQAGSIFLSQLISRLNHHLPYYFYIDDFGSIFTRLWFLTYVAIGLTEYYFMRIFLHPAARAYGWHFLNIYLLALLIIFCVLALFFREYSLVVSFHLLTHVLIIIFALYAILVRGARVFYQLIALVAFNLLASGAWSLMALGLLPTGTLHHNDWYHLLIMAFLVLLHWMLTRGGLVTALRDLEMPPGATPARAAAPGAPSTR